MGGEDQIYLVDRVVTIGLNNDELETAVQGAAAVGGLAIGAMIGGKAGAAIGGVAGVLIGTYTAARVDTLNLCAEFVYLEDLTVYARSYYCGTDITRYIWHSAV